MDNNSNTIKSVRDRIAVARHNCRTADDVVRDARKSGVGEAEAEAYRLACDAELNAALDELLEVAS